MRLVLLPLEAALMTVPLAAPLTHSVQGGRLTTVIVRTGITLKYADGGPADGQVVLFLHSYPESWYSCSRVLPLLPDGIRARQRRGDTAIPTAPTAATG
jgi:hypothetical protein